MQKICSGLADEFSGAPEGFFRQLVALPGSFGNLVGRKSPFAQNGFPAGRDLFRHIFCYGCAGCDRLQVPFYATRTDRPIREDGDMPKLGGHAAEASIKLSPQITPPPIPVLMVM